MQSPVLTEKDLEIIFSGKKKPKTQTPYFKAALFIFCFFLVSGAVYLVLNFSTLYANLAFWYKNEYKAAPLDQTTQNLADATAGVGTISMPEIENNSLFLPVINVKAPISWNIPNTPEKVTSGLEKGLIQLQGTALPGEVGNVFITGHSSNYPWAKGKYNNVFALLGKIVVGDVVQVKYNNVDYLYKIREVKVVEPTDTSVLKSKNESTLTLMTCTPVGTSLRRLILIGNQMYPDPSKNKDKQINNTDAGLPKVK